MEEQDKKIVMVFGVFDGCDEGHQYFLKEADKLGDELVVIVTRDTAVEKLKGKCPRNDLNERIAAIKALGIADFVVPGDMEQGSWAILEKFKPDIIALGHDQDGLKDALTAYTDTALHTIGKYAKS